MDRGILNYIVDMGLAITFILSFFTGITKWPGLVQKFGLSYNDLPMRAITLIHDWSGLIMGLLVLVHIILHWKWIVAFTKKILAKKNIDVNAEVKDDGKSQN